MGYRRAKHAQTPTTSILELENVSNQTEARAYLGKRVAFVYRAKKAVNGSKTRAIWGKITRPHGSGGKVRAQFKTPLPPQSFGSAVRVMLYPSSI
mgnify:CR=1 FL=1